MSETTLPDDVLEYLRRNSKPDPEGRADGAAVELLDKYTPKPTTLADYGIIRYDRVFVNEAVHTWSEMRAPEGLVGMDPEYKYERLPWPEVEGIDPLPLLNNGHRLMTWHDVPSDWLVVWHRGPVEVTKSSVIGSFHDADGVVVLARAPEYETPAPEMSALTKTALNRENPR